MIISYQLLLFKVMKEVSFGGREVLCFVSKQRNAYSYKLPTDATDTSGNYKSSVEKKPSMATGTLYFKP